MASTESTTLASYLCSRGGFVHDDLELFGRSSGERERGVFTVGPIRRGELLLRLPRDAVICACENEDAECGWMPKAARTVSPVLRTALYLMRELALGDGSSWAPYLRMLPCEYDTLEHWTADELEALRGTSVHDELSGLRDASGSLVGAAEILWRKEIRPLVEAHPALWPDASLGAFLRACAAVRTRGFFDAAATGGAAGPYMLPAIDMLNHSRAGQATSLVVERRVERTEGSAASRSGAGVSDNDVSSGHSAPSSESSGGITRGGNSPLVFSMRAERDLAAGEEVVHTYDDFSDSQLLLTYGFVSSDGEAALPTTALLTLEALLRAAKDTAEAATRSLPGPSGGSSSGGGGTGRSLPWVPLEGWFAKEAACARLLAPYGGRLAVSIVEPLPDALLTTMLLLMMPYEDFAELLGFDGVNVGEDGGGRNNVESGQIGMGAPRVPLLDSSVLEDEPLLAAIVVEATVAAISTAEARYQDETSAMRELGTTSDESEAHGTAHIRRLAAARALVQGERAALAATRRAALRLLVEVGLDNDGEDEEGEEDEGEEDEGEEDEGEEDEGEEDEGEEDEGEEDDDAQPPPPKQQRR
jgi:hypothetical protein